MRDGRRRNGFRIWLPHESFVNKTYATACLIFLRSAINRYIPWRLVRSSVARNGRRVDGGQNEGNELRFLELAAMLSDAEILS
jgi:hypothetical protein